jgi:hypothetical protein
LDFSEDHLSKKQASPNIRLREDARSLRLKNKLFDLRSGHVNRISS